jgi:hypothetical protein
LKVRRLFVGFLVLLFIQVQAIASELPRFLLSDPELEELLNDLFVRHLRIDLSDTSLRREGAPNPGEGLTLWNDWEVSQLHWFDSSRRTFPLEDRRKSFVSRLTSIPVDRFGYVWTAHLGFEDPMSGPGTGFGQGWPFPSYPESQGRSTGTEWNGDSLEGWTFRQCVDFEPKDGYLHFKTSGPFPELYSPILGIEAEHAPFIEIDFSLDEVRPPDPYIRWMRVSWTREDAPKWFDLRQVELKDFGTLPPVGLRPKQRYRLYFPMYLHPEWKGTIRQIRIAPFTYWGRAFAKFRYNYVRFVYDTRQAVNNSNYILGTWRYYLWSGDRSLVYRNLPNLRKALLFLNHHLRGEELHLLDQSPFFQGHDGAGAKPDGSPNPGHGIGTNYFDILGLGSKDFQSNLLYIRALEAMAQVERALPLARTTGGKVPSTSPFRGSQEIIYQASPDTLSELAAQVRNRVRDAFWNPETGRFAGGIDRRGNKIDYGFVYQNLEALAMGLPTPEQANQVLDWLDGRRTVDGDTSTGEDIYFWRFAPRTTTRRNQRHYVWTWVEALRNGEVLFGEQVQDGGAALWGSYYDILARIHYDRTESAWQRLKEILEWHREVRERGGKGHEFYRVAYQSGDALAKNPPILSPWDGLLQGGGKSGGLGLDEEFIENGLLPAAVLFGFLGVDIPRPEVFVIHPRIPKDLEFMGVTNILRGNDRLQIRAGHDWVDLSGSSLRTAGWKLLIGFDPPAKGSPRVLRDQEPYDSYTVLEDGSVAITDGGVVAHRYEVQWSEEVIPETLE